MGKNITVSALSLALMLTACTKEKGTDLPAEINNTTEPSQILRIAAAANLSDVLPEVIEGYKTDKGLPDQEIEVTFASSGKLYSQIISGAPYDIFLAANQDFPAQLLNEVFKGAANHTPFTYTQGQLSIYSATKAVGVFDQNTLTELLNSNDKSKITIANPELAPYGASAKSYLQTQNLYEALIGQKRLIQAENIGQAFQYAHTGSVDYGFVAHSQVIAMKATPEHFYLLPSTSYPAILQDGILITNEANAADFTDYLRSPTGQAYFSRAGYLAVR
ncbi:molybdate ABC transporter substrate-binding protein [Psychrobacter sp. ANT_H56B]|uniref:molybdate ABC transporter substrate-binding protein n=1 Tax=Psychrobacter sp. ANT_H56B TaxID=2597353 RepID=UPI0011F252D5|nr:molybdate ABC transporter substrate-binding protein [Psychrobacter sp. ANT_H56B]KAA0925459.1 molybdate ABC transporter substrate-binding protein [Psychrobacter sp. ANT_H56B]